MGFALGMQNYIVEIDHVDIESEHEIEVTGHDKESLLYNFLDEWLFVFSTEFFILKKIEIIDFERNNNWKIKAKGFGEIFNMEKHRDYRGTEIKAITYSNMQIHEKEDSTNIFVI
ncbi:protein archease [Anaeramoeba ignava]|uniref:Protein archease n=1 Tax=Anaeramoeba ignava TaxID=1746090 RepID=A0A9Q0LRM5_ANAIG|nr:protein archease [Anaeramoeba ignava]